MVQHIVMFKLTDNMSELEKFNLIDALTKEFETLPSKIEVLQSLKIYNNVNPKEDYDIVLIANLDLYPDVETYSKHPEHVALVEKYIKPYLVRRACSDIVVSKKVK